MFRRNGSMMQSVSSCIVISTPMINNAYFSIAIYSLNRERMFQDGKLTVKCERLHILQQNSRNMISSIENKQNSMHQTVKSDNDKSLSSFTTITCSSVITDHFYATCNIPILLFYTNTAYSLFCTAEILST